MILWEDFDKNELYILIMLVVSYTAFFSISEKITYIDYHIIFSLGIRELYFV
jgi:hypothetical protein